MLVMLNRFSDAHRQKCEIATTKHLIPHPLNLDALFWLMHHSVWFSCPYLDCICIDLRRHQYQGGLSDRANNSRTEPHYNWLPRKK